MTLTYMDETLLRQTLIRGWQKRLNVGWDPGNGQWYNGGPGWPGSGHPGLYGLVRDQLIRNAVVGDPVIVPGSETRSGGSFDVDNTDGLMNETVTQTLSYQYAQSQTTGQSATVAIRVGLSESISIQAGVPGAVFGSTTNFSFDITTTTSQSRTESTGATTTFSQSVPVRVPKGKIYRAILTYRIAHATIPYRIVLRLNGYTETWFQDRVRDPLSQPAYSEQRYNYGAQVEEIFHYALQAQPNADFKLVPGGVEVTIVHGNLDSQLTGDFRVRVIDVTDQPHLMKQGPGELIDLAALAKLTVAEIEPTDPFAPVELEPA